MNNSKITTNIIFALLSLFSLLCTYFIYGFYFDYYESLGSALLSGQLTPSISFNDWFYLGYIGFVKIFALLYDPNNMIDWYCLISYSLVWSALFLFLKTIYTNHNYPVGVFVFCIAVFFSEHFVLLNMNRVGFLLGFSSLVYLFKCSNSLNYYKKTIIYFFFTCAYFYRLEAAMLSFAIAIMTEITLNLSSLTFNRIKEIIKLSVYPAVLILTVSIWFKIDINNSDEFYKQIEPDVEYELMTRDNIIDNSEMTNFRDSLRYQAIFKGIWGDAHTNDVSFLRSLIGNKKSNIFSIEVLNKGWFEINIMSRELGIMPYAIILLFILNLGLLLYTDYKNILGLIFYQSGFVILLILIAGYIKMTETALSSLYFINFFTLLTTTFKKVSTSNNQFLITFILSMLIAFSIIKAVELKKISITKEKDVVSFKEKLDYIKVNAIDKKLYISGEAMNVFFHSHRPFEKFDFADFTGMYIFNSLAMNTISPYKDYLELECQCNPIDYSSLFMTIRNEDDNAIVLMSEDTKSFLEKYLKGVHDLEITFIKDNNIYFEAISNYSAGFNNEKSIYFYSILN